MQPYILTLHIIAATIWTGGHLILSIVILPKVLKEKNAQMLRDFESNYEKIGMPALIIQILTGFYLIYNMMPNLNKWLSFSDYFSTRIGIKIILLLTTILFALSAKFFVIPKLNDNNLKLMAFHIISVCFVIIGSSFKNAIF